MTVFPTVGHFASWAGAAPAPPVGRPTRLRNDPPRRHAGSPQLTECARAAVRTKRHLPRLPLRAAPRPPRRARKRSARSATTCSSPTTTSSATKSHTASSDPTGSTSATPPNTAPAGSQRQLEALGYPSPSNPPPEPVTARHPDPPTRASGPTARARTHPQPHPAGILTVGGRRFESVRGLSSFLLLRRCFRCRDRRRWAAAASIGRPRLGRRRR